MPRSNRGFKPRKVHRWECHTAQRTLAILITVKVRAAGFKQCVARGECVQILLSLRRMVGMMDFDRIQASADEGPHHLRLPSHARMGQRCNAACAVNHVQDVMRRRPNARDKRRASRGEIPIKRILYRRHVVRRDEGPREDGAPDRRAGRPRRRREQRRDIDRSAKRR